jgi:NAD-dependent SIR2 family protein deacetylase
VIASGALDTENLTERRARGLRTNPDGDVDIPGAPYSTFRYPACLTCLANGTPGVHVDGDGGWIPSSTSGNSSKDTGGGVLKPAVIMFGESIPAATKTAAEEAVDAASRILVIGSSLATYSAWRLVKRASENGMPIGVVNIGGVRGEETFFGHVGEESEGREGLRVSVDVGEVLPRVLEALEEGRGMRGWRAREERRLGGVA